MGTLIEGKKYMTDLRNIQQMWKKRNSDKPFEKQEVVLVKIGPCCELQFSALLGTTAVSWHKLGSTRKWFSLQLSVKGKQLRFSLKARLEKVILKIILLEQVHKNLSG